MFWLELVHGQCLYIVMTQGRSEGGIGGGGGG